LNSQLQLFWQFELAFDQRDTKALQEQVQADSDFDKLAKLVQMVAEDNLHLAIDFGKDIFENTRDPLAKGFIHHWVIGCMESLYLQGPREIWFENWIQIENWSTYPWLRYLRKYQMAIGLYFESYFREALSLFEQLAEEARVMDYQRGQEKCLYHIGLIYKCLNYQEKALIFFGAARDLAISRDSFRMLVRIEEVLRTIRESFWSASRDLNAIETLLREKKNRAARKMLLHALRIRRVEKREWGAYSEHMYIALVSLSFGRFSRFDKIYQTYLKDNLVKEKLLSLAGQLGQKLSAHYITELAYLRQLQGVSATLAGVTSEFLGVNLLKVKDPEAVAVIRNLSSNVEGLTKEQLCFRLWNYNYDPLLHDRRIYKLVHRIKEIFNCRDAIIAKGGLYRINPKYIHC
jgi:hypothetical protein